MTGNQSKPWHPNRKHYRWSRRENLTQILNTPLTEYRHHHHHAIVSRHIIHRVPEKKQATLIFDITSPPVEIFLPFLKHLVQD